MMQLNNIEIIVYLASNLFRMYIIDCFFRIFFKIEDSFRRKCLRGLCYGLYFGINSLGFLYFNWSPTIIIVTNVVGLLAVAITFKGTWKYRICSVVIIIAMNIVCEDLIYYLLVKIQIQRMFIIGIIAASILTFMIVLLLGKIVNLRRGENITIPEWLSVLIIPICSLFISAVVLENCKDEIIAALGGIGMVLINLMMFYLFDRIQNMYRMQFNLNLLEKQNHIYEHQMTLSRASTEQITALRHDMKNHFLALGQLAKQQDYGAIINYLNALIPFTELNMRYGATGNFMIDGFLNIKLEEAAKYGAEIETELRISKNINTNDKDMSIILGNLLDNSIRAIKEMDGSGCKKFLKVVMKEEPGKLFIHVANSYDGAVRKKGELFMTTKKISIGHGMGLKNVKRVVDEYNGQVSIEHLEGVFSVKLILFI